MMNALRGRALNRTSTAINHLILILFDINNEDFFGHKLFFPASFIDHL
jgi:hypothetical protein